MDETYTGILEAKYKSLKERIAQGQNDFDEKTLRDAYDFIIKAHENQKRESGEPYVIHPVEVAIIVADNMSLDICSVIAALLHDVIEDTEYSYDDIKKRFGEEVACLVDGVTKLTRVPYSSKEEQQMDNLRKMFYAMSRDIRVILIKIADRLHNMRTIQYRRENKRRQTSLETMEIYVPLAHRLGMQRIKCELEDRSLQNLDPVAYEELTRELELCAQDRSDLLESVKIVVQKRLKEAEITAAIEGRVKHIYSVYRKFYSQQKAMFEIYDLYAVRVIVDDTNDCYNVLGLIHDLYKPIPGRVKDFISTPKPNMYQSLHTTVIGREGVPFEVQIRTWEMHRLAEYGIAAHWKYKAALNGDISIEEKLEWVRRVLESQQDTDAEDFFRNFKVDMFADDVFVFTPRGDIINLPVGANPIDFAYAIHSAIGNRMVGAKANGRTVELNYQLQNGDILEIITGTNQGPSRDWLKMVKSAEARNKIKQWFKKERREENIIQGKNEFERELKRAGITIKMMGYEEIIQSVLKKLSFASIEDMYAALGYGGLTVIRVMSRLRDEMGRLNRLYGNKPTMEKVIQGIKKTQRTDSGVAIEGLTECIVKFSRCCTPIPGDEIIGFITRGFGVSIHRTDCQNVLSSTSEDAERWVQAVWTENNKTSYKAGLQIQAADRNDMLIGVLSAIGDAGIKIDSINSRKLDNNYMSIQCTLDVLNKEQLLSVKSKISTLDGVVEVRRRDIS